MDQIRGLGGSISPAPTLPRTPPPAGSTSFAGLLAQAQGPSPATATAPATVGANPLDGIPTEFIPMNTSTREVTGYKTTFLGTFCKKAQASIVRRPDSIVISSALGTMRIQLNPADGSSLYVEMPQGHFVGEVGRNGDGDVCIQSQDQAKSFTMHQETSGDITVRNKGIEDSIRLVFKAP